MFMDSLARLLQAVINSFVHNQQIPLIALVNEHRY